MIECIHGYDACPICDHPDANGGECAPLPEPRIVRLCIDGTVLHFATFSPAPLDDLRIGDLKPYPALDAAVWLEGLMKKADL